KPPRVAFGMYKRFAIAGVLITLLTAGTVASAGLLEVKDLVGVIRDESAGHVIPGLKGALDDVPAGKPQTTLVLGSDRPFVDVDKRYYHSNAGLPISQQYAEINVPAGYQKLCGSKSLDYVRFRHADDDLVRSARQQEFLRQAKDQIGLGRLFGDRKELLRIFGRYTDTDLHSNSAILRLLKLAFESSAHPTPDVPLPGDLS